MPTNVDGLLGLLLDVSIKAALLAGFAGLLLAVLRVRNANLQHRVWSTIVVAMLALPLLVCAVPHVPIPMVKRAAVTVDNNEETKPLLIRDVRMPRSARPAAAADKFVDPAAPTAVTPVPTLTDDVAHEADEPVAAP